MTLPEQALLKRRRQILNDETVGARRLQARAHPDTSAHQGPSHQDALHQDSWATSFVDRLAGLIRKIGGKNQA
jgi:hypothetical protein